MQHKVGLAARILLGLMFVVFGLNFFFKFLPMPPNNEAASNFMGALFMTGYIFPIIKTIEIVAGLMLLTGYFVPLAVLLLAPIVINIALVHFILDTSGAPIAALTLALTLIVAWSRKHAYAHVLKAKA